MILCMMRIPPHPDGHGGNQRAWHLLRALRKIDAVHLALVYPALDSAAVTVPLDQARALVDGITIFPCRAWGASAERWRGLPWGISTWIDRARIGSVDAPRLPGTLLRDLAQALPPRRYDTLFAARTSIATIADAMLRRGLIEARCRVVDIDDIMSQFRRRQRDAQAATIGVAAAALRANWNAALNSEIALLERTEARVAREWDGVAVCSEHDRDVVRALAPRTCVVRVPNVVDRPVLPPRMGGGLRLLFVGNLRFAPNTHGLARFLTEAWPRIVQQRPDAALDVVGLSPPTDVANLLAGLGISVHADVASVEPYYAAADIVIAPIFFGGGTRIKILEAMAFGRPVVSTTLGAEGLEVSSGREVILADTMPDFADAVVRLGDDRSERAALAVAARTLQQNRFSPAALDDAIADLIRIAQGGRP